MSLVNVRNCIRFYQTAEELNASTLVNYCAEIIASHWVSASPRDVEVGRLGLGTWFHRKVPLWSLVSSWNEIEGSIVALGELGGFCCFVFGSQSLVVLMLE